MTKQETISYYLAWIFFALIIIETLLIIMTKSDAVSCESINQILGDELDSCREDANNYFEESLECIKNVETWVLDVECNISNSDLEGTSNLNLNFHDYEKYLEAKRGFESGESELGECTILTKPEQVTLSGEPWLTFP